MRNPQKKIQLNNRNIPMGQYGPEDSEIDIYADDFEMTRKQENAYAKSIGTFILSFSSLEQTVNVDLAESINNRAHEQGFRIIKYLTFRTKIDILSGDYLYFIKNILNSGRKKDSLIKEVGIIYSKLKEMNEFRNKVAHADWTSLDKNGYVITKIDEAEKEGGLYFKKTKMTPGVIIKFTKQNYAIANKLSMFREKIWEANRIEDFKRYKKQEAEKLKSKKRTK